MYYLLILIVFAGCSTTQTVPSPSPPNGAALPPATAQEAVQDERASSAYQRTRGVTRIIYVSPTGSDDTACEDLSVAFHAKSISRAAQCVKAGEAIVVKSGEYTDSVVFKFGARRGLPILLTSDGPVVWHGPKHKPPLTIEGSYVHVFGFVLNGQVILGSKKKRTEGIVLEQSIVNGDLLTRNSGIREEDPGVAANVIKGSEVTGHTHVSGYDVQLRYNRLNQVSLDGSRHLLVSNDVGGRVRWDASKTAAWNNKFREAVNIGPTGDNVTFDRCNEFYSTIYIGSASGKDQVVGATFHHTLFVTANVNSLNTRSIQHIDNDVGEWNKVKVCKDKE